MRPAHTPLPAPLPGHAEASSRVRGGVPAGRASHTAGRTRTDFSGGRRATPVEARDGTGTTAPRLPGPESAPPALTSRATLTGPGPLTCPSPLTT